MEKTDATQFVERSSMDSTSLPSFSSCFKHKARFLVLLLSTLCLTSVLSNILTFNFTVICMAEPPAASLPSIGSNWSRAASAKWPAHEGAKLSRPNASSRHEVQKPPAEVGTKFHWSPMTKSVCFGAIAVGALLTVLPVTILISRMGPKKIFLAVGAITTMATGLCPIAVVAGDNYFIVMRVLQGVALAACMPVIGCVTSSWATLSENGLFLGIATSFIQLAPIFTMPLAGVLCVSSYGWPAVYYVHAAVSLVMFALWALFYEEKPRNCGWVSEKELTRVMEGKAPPKTSADGRSVIPAAVPYGAILRTPAVWAIWVATLVNFLGIYLIVLFAPTFINKTLLFPIEKTGALAAIPAIVQFFIKIVVGPASDRIQCFSDTFKVKLTNTIAFMSMGLLYLALSFMHFDGNQVFALVLLFAAGSLLGFNVGGFFKSATLVSRHHSHFVMGVVQMLMCVCMLFVPIIVQMLAPNNSEQEWHQVFMIHGALLVVGNVVFCLFGSGQPAPWALDSWPQKSQTSANLPKIAPMTKIDFLPAFTIANSQNQK
uniref:Major facilitator superfamily (MFS) profile domain-containing protein n=1 Tax=Plectus sambesii TaxID=2011161 RepID=A0A914V8C5_9BILA